MTRMRPLLQHAFRSFIANPVPVAPKRANNGAFKAFARAASSASPKFRCCQSGASSTFVSRSHNVQLNIRDLCTKTTRRQFSISQRAAQKEDEAIPLQPPSPPTEDARPTPNEPYTAPKLDTVQQGIVEASRKLDSAQEDIIAAFEELDLSKQATTSARAQPSAAKVEKVEDTIARVPAEDLPSHRERQRWDFSKRIQEIMDDVLPKLAVVTQKVNTYTGTDYTSIAALKREIQEQEKLVKARRAAIEEAKQALEAAHAQQGSSQKEVVSLLERKHSWSATDLERYMSLIRSEHVNDQAIREAKDNVLAAETALEEARARLEKRERAQYHEEQIWSDTIRRNSTWVTFGLMGLNIFLLLLNLVVLEPWRRRKMVREIKAVLAEGQKQPVMPETAATLAAAPVVSAPLPAAANLPPPAPTAPVEAEVAKSMESVAQPSEEVAPKAPPIVPEPATEPAAMAPETTEAVQDQTTDLDTAAPAAELPALVSPDEVDPIATMDIEKEALQDMTPLEKITARLERIPTQLRQLKSDEEISVRKKDLTAAVCISAATGYVMAAVVFWFWNR